MGRRPQGTRRNNKHKKEKENEKQEMHTLFASRVDLFTNAFAYGVRRSLLGISGENGWFA